MNDSTYFERNDTGIMSLADLFRQGRLPCRVEPKRWLPKDTILAPGDRRDQPAIAPPPNPAA